MTQDGVPTSLRLSEQAVRMLANEKPSTSYLGQKYSEMIERCADSLPGMHVPLCRRTTCGLSPGHPAFVCSGTLSHSNPPSSPSFRPSDSTPTLSGMVKVHTS